MKIANVKKEVENSIKLNDRDYMNRLLSSLKEISKNLTIALTEASNKVLYERLLNHFLEIINLQRKIYEVMFVNGWYELETADKSKIKTKYNTLYQDFSGLSNN